MGMEGNAGEGRENGMEWKRRGLKTLLSQTEDWKVKIRQCKVAGALFSIGFLSWPLEAPRLTVRSRPVPSLTRVGGPRGRVTE